MSGRWQLFGRGLCRGLAGLVLAAAPAQVVFAQSAAAPAAPVPIVVGGLPDQVPVEVVVPPAGVVVRVKAPPAGGRHAAAAAGRTETGRQMMAATSVTDTHAAVRVIPYAGGPLSAEVLDVPPGTPVLLEYVPTIDDAAGQEAARADEAALGADVDRVLEHAGGALPEEAVSAPPGTVVGLSAPSLPADDEARASFAEAADGVEAFETDLPYAAGVLPDYALDPPPGTVVRLEAPPAGEAVEVVASMPPESPAGRVVKEIVVAYRKGSLPKAALAPPPGTVIHLRAP